MLIILAIVVVAVLVFLLYVSSLVGKIKRGELNPYFSKSYTGQATSGEKSTYEISTLGDPYLGPEDAKLVLVEFGDFKCSHTKAEFNVVRELAATYPNDLKIVFKDFALLSDDSRTLAMAGECANEQNKFWSLYDYFFINFDTLNVNNLEAIANNLGLDQNKFRICMNNNKYGSEIDSDIRDALSATVSGTPTFFLNGYKIEGAVPLQNFKDLIDKILLATKQP